MSAGFVAAFEDIGDSESDVIVILTSSKKKNSIDICMFYKVTIL